ncbi:MAG: thiolase family protein [Sphingomonadaceae bacterium]|uniref:thiolase family protein n=1 Tax=Thermaurantiacus sp. TaxID=2820283 RepID=UPI00298F1BC9|nr:thiolase family protein [Thermaurantiacus sp.]MCS6987152.1 thiolase family protein [Sphingomonadaceae bacterium]MDW8415814.1 thiolase family protein [Thermaurantiacus sp.]
MSDVAIIGAGIHPFGRHDGVPGLRQGVVAARAALADAGVAWSDIEIAFGGSAAAGNADTMVTELGLTGVPFLNVANGCATGGSALFSAAAAIRAGMADLALVVGFDKHPRGAFDPKPADWGLPDWYGEVGLMLTTQFFALKLRRYMETYGISTRTLGLVAEKAFANGALAPHAWRRTPLDLETILSAPMVNDPLTRYMFCQPAEGAVGLVLASARKVRELGVACPVWLRATAVRTRPQGSFEVFSPSLDLERGVSPTVLASRAAFEEAGLGPEDVSVAQLQDTESGAEIMHMAENGFCADGAQEAWIAEGRTRIGGKLPINTDGGCLACGEPIGASGLRQVYENVQQLKGTAGARQVEGARVAYSHVYGAPGLSAVTILSL